MQASANRNRAVLFLAKLAVQGLKLKKAIVQILECFLLVVQLMMQIKFNFNNFVLYGVSGSVPAAYAVVAGGCDWPLTCAVAYSIMTSLRYVPYVSFVTFLTLRALRWMETLL